MSKLNVAQDIHIVPITAPAQITSTTVAPHINMKLYRKVEFIVAMGAIGGDAFTITATQSAATAGSSSTAIAARYRLTAAAGTDTMGDVTALATTGFVTVNGTHENMTLIVDIDSADMTTASKPYVGLTLTDSGSGDVFFSITALCWPRYPKEANDGALT
jgi:hypothetical protein